MSNSIRCNLLQIETVRVFFSHAGNFICCKQLFNYHRYRVGCLMLTDTSSLATALLKATLRKYL